MKKNVPGIIFMKKVEGRNPGRYYNYLIIPSLKFPNQNRSEREWGVGSKESDKYCYRREDVC